jgi:hypothetical protein
MSRVWGRIFSDEGNLAATPPAGLFMSARNFLIVILSDEVAAATEESKEPYGRQQSQTCCCAKQLHGDFSQL